jgi:hypothetical protein
MSDQQPHILSGYVADTPESIAAFRILAMEKALKLELKGLKMSRGRSVYARVKDEFGFKGNRQKVLDQLSEWITENLFGGER